MTREEFERLMDADGWTPEQKFLWSNMTPVADAETFKREMTKPGGLIEVSRHSPPGRLTLLWKRVFKIAPFADPGI